MNVLVKNLKIKNFRSCIETDVYVNPYTALVGYNNAGKSNIILAMKFIFKGKCLQAKITDTKP